MRFARVVALEVGHHITQRGNARRFILETDTERGLYLDLLQQGIHRHGVELIGYCLMSNHVHLVAVPQSKDALARSFALERQEHRPLIRQKPGPKKRSEPGHEQAIFSFDPF